jgi:glycosyltransferase involved in cell wall biosynthesis
MNLLLLDQYSDLGGAQHCLLDLLPAFRQIGWETVLAAPGHGALLERAHRAGAHIEHLSRETYSAGSKSVVDIVRFAGHFPGTAQRIRELAARHRIDLLYINGPRLVAAAVWAAGRTIPLVFHCHSFVPQRYCAPLVRWPLAWAGATVVSSSEFSARSIGLKRPVHVIYNGVPDCRRPRVSARTGYRIGVVGRISPQKGQLLFVHAVRLLMDALPECSFEICGAPLFSDPDSIRYEKDVHQLAQGLPVEFTGWTDDIGAVLARLDLLVVPSIGTEATTRVILEAFSAGVPVVAFDTGGISEVISPGKAGFLVAEKTSDALAGMILMAVSQGRSSLKAIGDAARNEWERRYTLERYQSEIVELLVRARAGFKAAEQGPERKGRGNCSDGDYGKDHRIAKA